MMAKQESPVYGKEDAGAGLQAYWYFGKERKPSTVYCYDHSIGVGEKPKTMRFIKEPVDAKTHL
jgi:hypothetical protein